MVAGAHKAKFEAFLNGHNYRIADLNAIIAVSTAVSESLDLPTVLNCAIDKALEVTGMDAGGISLLVNGGKELELRVNRNTSKEFFNQYRRVRIGERMSGKVAARGEPLWIEDASVDPAYSKPIFKKEGFKFVIGIPLKAKDKVLGVLTLTSRRKMRFSEDQLGPLLAIGNQIGIAIENSSLHERVKRQTERLEALQEEERKRISRELHDEAGQGLEAMKIELGLLRNSLPKDYTKAHNIIGIMEELTDRILQEIRRLTHDLRPAILDDLGLLPALRCYTKDFSRRYGISVGFTSGRKNVNVSQEVKTMLYRTVQEGLRNVAKHSGAKKAAVRISVKDEKLSLFVEDHGKGFDVERVLRMNQRTQGLGLLGIIERVSALKGTFSLTSQPGRGTRLAVSMPISHGKN